jgi:hypothetical protein
LSEVDRGHLDARVLLETGWTTVDALFDEIEHRMAKYGFDMCLTVFDAISNEDMREATQWREEYANR